MKGMLLGGKREENGKKTAKRIISGYKGDKKRMKLGGTGWKTLQDGEWAMVGYQGIRK